MSNQFSVLFNINIDHFKFGQFSLDHDVDLGKEGLAHTAIGLAKQGQAMERCFLNFHQTFQIIYFNIQIEYKGVPCTERVLYGQIWLFLRKIVKIIGFPETFIRKTV